MTDQQSAIIKRCRELGIDQHGLGSVRNFIRAAFYHAGLDGTLPGDAAVAFNTAIRRATNRIACRGRHGIGRAESRVLSRRAVDLRESILANQEILVGKKFGTWMSLVTEEHQDPALAVDAWIRESGPTVDDVVQRLLAHPAVIITRDEERAIPRQFRTTGTPAERYRAAAIEPVLVEEGTFDFFRNRLSKGGARRKTKYHVPALAFEA